MDKEEKIENKFKELIGELTDEEFWKWTSDWLDEQFVLDIANDWDIETKENELKALTTIISKRGKNGITEVKE